MKKWNVRAVTKEFVITAVFLFILTNIISYVRKPTLDSERLPQLDVQLLDKSKYHVKNGTPLIVHFWATWCPTCKLEASNIESISKDYEVLTIAVNSGSDKEIKAYMKERGLTFHVLNDSDGQWAQQFKVEAYPTTFIYDTQGILKFTEVGYTTTAGLLARLKMSEK